MDEQPKRRTVIKWDYLVAGIVLGALAILAIRFVAYNPEETHYHANFAVYINSEREEFKGQQYYEEVKICAQEGAALPAARTHMHDNENGVVHVHDDAVTWGHFFANLGWVLGPDFIRTNSEMFAANDDNQLHIILNDQNLTGISSIVNQTIGNEDRLLISYGSADRATLDKQFESVLSDADVYNTKDDPANCGGSKKPTLSERFKNLL